MEYIIASVIVAAGLVIAALVWRSRPSPSQQAQADASISLLQAEWHASVQQTTRQMELLRTSLQETMQSVSGQLTRTLSDSNRLVNERLDSTSTVIGDVRQQLGRLEETSRRLLQLGESMAQLEDLLKPPKLRGSLGEMLLADLLRQVLPEAHFTLQHKFHGGETVDAVIRLDRGMVPVDAKFPLDNFRRIAAAQAGEQQALRKCFMRDVRTHIDDISSKYIRMDENTLDFALMYVPAENVYYETIIKEADDDTSIYEYALKKRVIPVSPHTLYVYLQTILLGLKGMRVEERSREIIASLSRLHREFDNFSEAFRLVGQHLDNSVKKYTETLKRFGTLESKVEQVDDLARGLATDVPDQGAPG